MPNDAQKIAEALAKAEEDKWSSGYGSRLGIQEKIDVIAPHVIDVKKLARVMWKNRHGDSYDEYAWLSFTSEDELLTYLRTAIHEFRGEADDGKK